MKQTTWTFPSLDMPSDVTFITLTSQAKRHILKCKTFVEELFSPHPMKCAPLSAQKVYYSTVFHVTQCELTSTPVEDCLCCADTAAGEADCPRGATHTARL